MGKDNLTAVLRGINDLRLEQRPIPKPEKNEVIIAMHSVGICGSDVHYLASGRIGNFVVEGPLVLGHESSGTVVEVGADVKNLKPGDRVAIEPGVPCRICDLCKRGRYNLCQDVKFCATPPVDGTLTRFYAHPSDFCFKLPDHVSFEEGALLEPLSVAVHACRRGKVGAGDAVLICGAGPIGLVNMLTAKAMGASSICIVDIVQSRLDFAKQLNPQVATVLATKETSADELTSRVLESLGRSPNVSIECSGAPSSVILALKATASGGCAVLVGAGPKDQTLPVVETTMREVDIRGIFRYANCYPIALELIASGAIDVKPLVTHRFKLEQACDAFNAAKSGAGVKIMIKCSMDETL